MKPANSRPRALAMRAGLAILTIALLPNSLPSLRQESEPPLKALLRGLGSDQVISMGVPFQLTLDGKTHQVKLDLLPTRELCIPGICFDYPSQLTFEFDPAQASKTWTLSGNDLTVMVQENSVPIDIEEFAETLADSLSNVGDGTIEWEEAPALKIEGLRIMGKRMVTPLGDMEFCTNVYGILSGTRGNRAKILLMTQEVRDKGEGTSQEVLEFHQLLQETLRASK